MGLSYHLRRNAFISWHAHTCGHSRWPRGLQRAHHWWGTWGSLGRLSHDRFCRRPGTSRTEPQYPALHFHRLIFWFQRAILPSHQRLSHSTCRTLFFAPSESTSKCSLRAPSVSIPCKVSRPFSSSEYPYQSGRKYQHHSFRSLLMLLQSLRTPLHTNHSAQLLHLHRAA